MTRVPWKVKTRTYMIVTTSRTMAKRKAVESDRRTRHRADFRGCKITRFGKGAFIVKLT